MNPSWIWKCDKCHLQLKRPPSDKKHVEDLGKPCGGRFRKVEIVYPAMTPKEWEHIRSEWGRKLWDAVGGYPVLKTKQKPKERTKNGKTKAGEKQKFQRLV